MCQIYLVLPYDNDKTEKYILNIFQWHHVDLIQSIEGNHQNIYQITMDSVVYCCFGKFQTVYYNDPELVFNRLADNTFDEYQKHYLVEDFKVDAERQKRWCLLSAEEWIAFLTSLVKYTKVATLFYIYEELNESYKDALRKPAQKISVSDLCADTLLYLASETTLKISMI